MGVLFEDIYRRYIRLTTENSRSKLFDQMG
jgi:hypothetical protein